MTLFRVGQRVKLRLLDGQTVDADVVRPGRWRSLVTWEMHTYWDRPGDMGPPHAVTKWRWNHRMWDQRAVDAAQRQR